MRSEGWQAKEGFWSGLTILGRDRAASGRWGRNEGRSGSTRGSGGVRHSGEREPDHSRNDDADRSPRHDFRTPRIILQPDQLT